MRKACETGRSEGGQWGLVSADVYPCGEGLCANEEEDGREHQHVMWPGLHLSKGETGLVFYGWP